MKICLETSDFYCWASSRSRIPCPCWWKVKLEKSYSSTNHHIFQFFCRGEFSQGRSVGKVLGKHYRMSCLDPGGKISYCNLYERHHKGCCTLPLPQVCHQCIQEWVKYTVWKRILNYFLKKKNKAYENISFNTSFPGDILLWNDKEDTSRAWVLAFTGTFWIIRGTL